MQCQHEIKIVVDGRSQIRRSCSCIWMATFVLVGLLAYSVEPAPGLAVPVQSSKTPLTSAPDSPSAAQMPTAASWPQFLESVRQHALAYSSALPDFTCTQHVWRRAKFGLSGPWETVDEMLVEVSYHQEEGESYKVLTIDNKPPSSKTNITQAGFSTQGDFGSALYLLFSPESNASFRLEGPDRTKGRRTVRARFYVPRSSSKYDISLGNERVTTAYSGRCWIELASRQVVRLESVAREIPTSSPVRASSSTTEYNLVEIAGIQYWLPVRTSVYLRVANDRSHDQIDFFRAIYGRSSGTFYDMLEAQNTSTIASLVLKCASKLTSAVAQVP
jgi:hypothetical protein